MTYHTLEGEFEIDINGNEVPAKKWELRIPSVEDEEDPCRRLSKSGQKHKIISLENKSIKLLT
jgi:hypothetical protein